MGKAMASKPAPVFPVTTLTGKGTDWAPTLEAIGFIEPNQAWISALKSLVQSIKSRLNQVRK